MNTKLEAKVTAFTTALVESGRYKDITVIEGRKYIRVLSGRMVEFFIDVYTGAIFGAKSAVQHNARRYYGTLDDVDQMNWVDRTPIQNTKLYTVIQNREEQIVKNYKPRGRPRKNPVVTNTGDVK